MTVTPHTIVHRLARRFLEPTQDVLVLSIGVALFGCDGEPPACFWPRAVRARPGLPCVVIGEVLFMLVMVEAVRLLIIYLRGAPGGRRLHGGAEPRGDAARGRAGA